MAGKDPKDPKDPTLDPNAARGDGMDDKLDTLDGLDLASDEFDLDAAAFELDDAAFDSTAGLEEAAELAAEGLFDDLGGETQAVEPLADDAAAGDDFPEDFSQPQEVSSLDDMVLDDSASGYHQRGKRMAHATDVVWSPENQESGPPPGSGEEIDDGAIKNMQTIDFESGADESFGDPNVDVNDLLSDELTGESEPQSSSLEELDFESLLDGDDGVMDDGEDLLSSLSTPGDEAMDFGDDDTFFADGPGGDDGVLGSLDLDIPDGAGPGLTPNVAESSGGPGPDLKKRRKASRSFVLIVSVSLMITAVGVVGAALGYGFFFVDLMAEDKTADLPPPPPPVAEEEAEKEAEKVVEAVPALADIAQVFDKAIGDAQAELDGDPSNLEFGEHLLQLQLMYRYRWPGRFDRSEAFKASITTLQSAGRGAMGEAKFWELLGQIRLLDIWGTQPPSGKSRALVLIDADKELADLDSRALPIGRAQLYKGLVFQEQGKSEAALDLFNRSLARNGRDDMVLYVKGLLLHRLDRLDEAQKTVDLLLDLSTRHHDGRLLAARIALARKTPEALQLARGFVEQSQEGAKADGDTYGEYEANLMRAVVYGRQEDAAKQIEALEQAAKFNPRDEQLLLNLAANDLKTGDPAKAVARLKACPEKVCGSSGYYLLYVEALMNNEQLVDAEDVVSKGVGLYPKDIELLLIGARVYEKSGNSTRASANYLSVIEMSPTKVDAYLRLATIYGNQGNYQNATDVLSSAVKAVAKADPKSTSMLSVLALRARLLLEAGWLEKARDAYARVLAVDETQTEARMQLAIIMSQLGDYDGAVKNFEIFYRQRRHNPTVVVAFGETLVRGGQPQRAIKELTDFLRVNPGHLAALTMLGYAYEQVQDFDNAEAVLREAHRIDPSNAAVYFMSGRLELARERKKAVDFESKKSTVRADFRKAVVALSSAVDKAPDNLEYRRTLAQGLTESGRKQNLLSALEQYERIVRIYKTKLKEKSPVIRRGAVYYERGILASHLGQDRMDVLQDFREAVLLDPTRVDLIARFAEELYLAQFKTKDRKGGSVSESEVYLKFVVENDSKHVRANYYLGRVRLRQWANQRPPVPGNTLHNAARVHFERVVARDQGKQFPVAYKELADVYKERKMYRMARRYYQEYLRAYQREKGTVPDDARYVRNLLRELN